jgi:hypothetical protein
MLIPDPVSGIFFPSRIQGPKRHFFVVSFLSDSWLCCSPKQALYIPFFNHPFMYMSDQSLLLKKYQLMSDCCSVSKRPDRLISKLKTMNIEEVARGGPRIIVVRQPRYSCSYSRAPGLHSGLPTCIGPLIWCSISDAEKLPYTLWQFCGLTLVSMRIRVRMQSLL